VRPNLEHDRFHAVMLQALRIEESCRFLKKAAQKLLLLWACGAETAPPNSQRTDFQ
jgi:hypothetical protein